MGCTVTLKATKTTTYPVKGNTLKDIWTSIQKTGPKDPNDNKKVVALTASTIIVADKWDSEMRGGKSLTNGNHQVIVGVKNMSMTVEGTIKLPKLGSSKLSKSAKKEWDRFMKKLIAHEKEHVAKTKTLAEQMGKEILKIQGTGEGATQEDAYAQAEKACLDNFLAQYSGPKIAKRVAEMHKKFDKASAHGTKHGAKLDYSIT